MGQVRGVRPGQLELAMAGGYSRWLLAACFCAGPAERAAAAAGGGSAEVRSVRGRFAFGTRDIAAGAWP